MSQFDPEKIEYFEYSGYRLDVSQGHLELAFALVGERRYEFVEEVSVPGGDYDDTVLATADRVSRLLFLAAGLSYYKLAAPKKIVVNVPITAEEKDFLAQLIKGGLTEFAYVNNLPQALTPIIEAKEIVPAEPITLEGEGQGHPVVPVGGGKDSVVTIEALRSAGFEPLLFSVNSYEPIQKTVDRAELPYTQAGRRISPELLELNKQGAYNGHVPVTAINSLIALLVAVLTGNRAVAFSNERSANVGNLHWEGVEVNHQWSKSIMFEGLLQQVLKQVVSLQLQYFSLLRPFSELRIARQFATLTQYHDVFTSCNRAFHLDEMKRQNWCGHCDKCRFVFLILAPYMTRETLMGIFKKDMLDDGEQLAGYRALLGIEGHKPLECVGEIAESRLAFMLLVEQEQWEGSSLVAVLREDLPDDAMPTDEQQAEIFSTGEHLVPGKYQPALDHIA